MKIFFYCQHVLGIGHLFRSLEICKALSGHEVVLITGGPQITITLPRHVRTFHLPKLQMDSGFSGLLSSDQQLSVDQIKEQRKQELLALFEREKPDIFLVELYPFGRKAFRFELDPVLEAISQNKFAACKVVCSVRDILVEKEDQHRHEDRALKTLNQYFDAVLVHSDPELIRFEETFFRFDDIKIPVVYTGFVAQHCPAGARNRIRKQLGLDQTQNLIVASAGGGSVGAVLLESAVEAFQRLSGGSANYLRIYTGPYIAQNDYESLKRLAGRRVTIERFSADFISYLAAADLSISMAGYNTSMNILASRVRALVWPFAQNHEQTMRAGRLAAIGALELIDQQDLAPHRLGQKIDRSLSQRSTVSFNVNIEGAANTARWLEH
ncbi:MAG: glycosyltransferase [Desulfobacterales bacterium]|jgi:predicted glycosyltransferase